MSTMTLFFLLIAIGGGVVFLIWALNTNAFDKMRFWAKAKVGKAGRRFEEDDPVAQMRQAAADQTDNIAKARDALVKAEALKKSLERQTAADRSEEAILTARINKKLDAGVAQDDADVKALAEQLARVKKSRATNEQQLADNVAFYNTTLAAAKQASARISEIENRATKLQVRLDLSKAQADLADMSDRFKPSSLNGAVQSAAKFEEIAERKIEENAARLRVNAEFTDPAEVTEKELASADAESALAEIVAARGKK